MRVICPICIVLFTIIIWFWYMEICPFKCDNKIYAENLLYDKNNKLKTGDLILFKSTDSRNSIRLCNYFTHIGMVIVDEVLTNNIPYIFEAAPTKHMEISDKRKNMWNVKLDRGILLTSLEERLKKYRGHMFYKELSHSVSHDNSLNLINFIFYALKNMEYDYDIFLSGARKTFCGERCNNKTNCGEIIFLCLMHMELISSDMWYNKTCPGVATFYIAHYLKWICNITELNDKYTYKPIVKIIKMTV